MKLIKTEIPEVLVIEPRKFADDRGFFSETYNYRQFLEKEINLNFVQDNHSFSEEKYTLRGLHYQSPPFAQDKLVRVIRGSILDVAVDIRHGSPTFGKSVAIELNSDNWLQLLVPKGFAHGILTLEKNTEIIYKVTDFYSPENDKGIIWNDPTLAINWPVAENMLKMSEKDIKQPLFSEVEKHFRY